MTLRNESVRVTAHFEEEGAVLAGTQRGSCRGFSIELSLEGDFSTGEAIELMRMAHQMCFTESALTRPVALQASHFFNGEPVEVGDTGS